MRSKPARTKSAQSRRASTIATASENAAASCSDFSFRSLRAIKGRIPAFHPAAVSVPTPAFAIVANELRDVQPGSPAPPGDCREISN